MRVFLYFSRLGLKVRQVAIFTKHSIVDVWQCSEFTSGSRYAFTSKYGRVLNIPFPKYKKNSFLRKSKKVPVSWKFEKLFLSKYKKIFQGRYKFFWAKNFEGWGWKVRQVAAHYTAHKHKENCAFLCENAF